jgi:cytochrome c
MDSFEWNKIFMGLGFSVLALLGINELSKALVHAHPLEKAAIQIEGLEAAAEAAGPETAAADVLPDWGTVLASADVAKGQELAEKHCKSCHSWNAGGANGTGPNLFGIMGNTHAHIDGFNYSNAMAALKGTPWTYDEIYKFVKKPGDYIKGTKMAFAGLRKGDERVALIAYMRTWAEPGKELAIPAPRPAEAAPAEAPAAAPEAAPAVAPAGAPEPAPAVAPAGGAPAETPATPAAEGAAPVEAPAAPAVEAPAAPAGSVPVEAPAVPGAEAPAAPEAAPAAGPAAPAAEPAAPTPPATGAPPQ